LFYYYWLFLDAKHDLLPIITHPFEENAVSAELKFFSEKEKKNVNIKVSLGVNQPDEKTNDFNYNVLQNSIAYSNAHALIKLSEEYNKGNTLEAYKILKLQKNNTKLYLSQMKNSEIDLSEMKHEYDRLMQLDQIVSQVMKYEQIDYNKYNIANSSLEGISDIDVQRSVLEGAKLANSTQFGIWSTLAEIYVVMNE
jgi:hypothetical protein